MSFRYAAILVTSWICLMYGVALPIMFPIGAFTYFNYYVVDKFLVAYYFRRPPIYDDKLQRMSLGTVKYAPVLMFFFGWWSMGNMQIFNSNYVDNSDFDLVNTAIPIETGHNIAPILD